MRRVRFGIVAIAVAMVFVVAYGAFLTWRFERRMPEAPVAVERPLPPAADVSVVSADLCRVGRAQRSYFPAVGRYASAFELRSDGDLSSPVDGRWPYTYTVHTPATDRFVVVASPVGTPLQGRAPAIVLDDTLQVCVLKPEMPDEGWRLDHPAERWSDRVSYECEKCP